MKASGFADRERLFGTVRCDRDHRDDEGSFVAGVELVANSGTAHVQAGLGCGRIAGARGDDVVDDGAGVVDDVVNVVAAAAWGCRRGGMGCRRGGMGCR